jgi:hypothetical protein
MSEVLLHGIRYLRMRIASGMVLPGIVCCVHYEGFEMGMNIMSLQNNDNGLKLESAERP